MTTTHTHTIDCDTRMVTTIRDGVTTRSAEFCCSDAQDTAALSELQRGDHFTIDGQSVLVFVDVEHQEDGPGARIRYHFPERPGTYLTRKIVDVADRTFRKVAR